MSNLAHASKPKEHDDNDDFQRITGRAAERRGKRPEDLLGDKGLMKELKVRLMERMLGAELTEHLGYEPQANLRMPSKQPPQWHDAQDAEGQ